jgi:hypothetical protein
VPPRDDPRHAPRRRERRSTVSTAAWQRCQVPEPSSPTAPLTGLIVRPAASYSRDWNTAARGREKEKKKTCIDQLR